MYFQLELSWYENLCKSSYIVIRIMAYLCSGSVDHLILPDLQAIMTISSQLSHTHYSWNYIDVVESQYMIYCDICRQQ